MKKIILCLLSLCFLFTGCKGKKNEQPIALEQTFHNINFELYAGEIVVDEGEELLLCHQNGTPIPYEIKDDTLTIINKSNGSINLTLPANYIYDTISINSNAGDLTFKPMPECNQLNLEVKYGNIVLSKAKSNATNILLHDGYIFTSGILGEIVNVKCEDGYIKLKPSVKKIDYNFNIQLKEDAYLNLSGYRYDNVELTEQVYNRVQQTMNIEADSGNVIIKFKS